MSRKKAPCHKPLYDFGACLVCVRSHCPNENVKEKKLKVFINGEEKEVSGGEVDFRWVVKDMLGLNTKYAYTVTFSAKRDDGSHFDGILSLGSKKHIKLEEGMIFNCCDTGNA